MSGRHVDWDRLAPAKVSRVLELGCGTGRWLAELRTAGFEPVEYRVAEWLRMSRTGRAILDDAFPAKHRNSMLAL